MWFLDLWIGFLFCILVEWKSLSYVRLFVTPWTVAHRAPLSVEFSRKNTGVGNHSLLQGIFPTQGWNPGLLHCRQIPYHLNHQGSPLQLRRRTWPRWCGPCPFCGRLMRIRLTWGKMAVSQRSAVTRALWSRGWQPGSHGGSQVLAASRPLLNVIRLSATGTPWPDCFLCL